MHLDHLILRVPPSKFEGVVAFLIASLKHMGFREHMRYPGVVGLGSDWAWLWINGSESGDSQPDTENALKGTHVAFKADTTAQVDEFHKAALEAGGKDHGAPGPRPFYEPTFYGPRYYGAFVLDPECGINFELVYKGE